MLHPNSEVKNVLVCLIPISAKRYLNVQRRRAGGLARLAQGSSSWSSTATMMLREKGTRIGGCSMLSSGVSVTVSDLNRDVYSRAGLAFQRPEQESMSYTKILYIFFFLFFFKLIRISCFNDQNITL